MIFDGSLNNFCMIQNQWLKLCCSLNTLIKFQILNGPTSSYARALSRKHFKNELECWLHLKRHTLHCAVKWRNLSQTGKIGSGKNPKYFFSYWAWSTPWGHVLSLKTFRQNPALSWAISNSVFQPVKFTK